MREPLRIFLVDDEPLARVRVKALLQDCQPILPNAVVGEASSGHEALTLFADARPDVILLDIRMPGMDGIDTAREIARQPGSPVVIFLTAFEAHALSAFDVGARDYLLKPVRKDRLLEALTRVRQAPPPKPRASTIKVNDRGRVWHVPIIDILFMRAEMRYVTLRTLEQEFVLNEPLGKLEAQYGSEFLRIHRNCLVNRTHLAGFELERTGEDTHWVAVLKDWPERLPVSRRQAQVVKEFAK